MPSSRKVQKSFDRNDKFRSLLTDTAPGDLPLIVSNDGLRLNLGRTEKMNVDVASIVAKTFLSNQNAYTAPYRYKIGKTDGSMRSLSLVHPKSQLAVAEFLSRYENLITYYASRSNYSIRYPQRVASTFFYRSPYADANRYRAAEVDAVGQDRLYRHPSSYFAYGGHTRYHAFFSSDDFHLLEKRFSRMMLLDVSKCFSSIYTHTVAWAVQDMPHGKKHTSAVSFGNDFDRVMQKMNYNETNGLAIGSEISRICAEIVLQSVDVGIQSRLARHDLRQQYGYDIRRYVDDFVVFSNDEEVEGTVRRVIADELSKFNLHLNETKTEIVLRPFQTKKSAVIESVTGILNSFWSSHTDVVGEKDRYSVAKKMRDRHKVAKSFIRSIKTVCVEQHSGYGDVANFLIGAMDIRIQMLIDSADRRRKDEDFADRHLDFMLCLLEVSFFLYSVSPSVSSSSKLARSIILISRFAASGPASRSDQVSEEITCWAIEFFAQPFGHGELEGSHVPVEQLNILLALGELSASYRSRLEPVLLRVIKLGRADYFSIVTALYVARGTFELLKVTEAIEAAIYAILDDLDIVFRSADAHLVFDLLSCPYLSDQMRHETLSRIFIKLDLGEIGKARRAAALDEFSENPWFVRWGRIDLLRMLERRELNSVY